MYVISQVYTTGSYHPLHFTIPFINTNSYKFSYFPRTIIEDTYLPHHLIELESVDLFVVSVIACKLVAM